MNSPKLDVLAIGDAIVDVIATCDDSFLLERSIAKGGMRLLDEREADELYQAMSPAMEISGGSAANTMSGIAALGGSAGFVGQVADDQLGKIFAHDIRTLGVRFDTRPIQCPPPTGRCLILVTPDAQRTMSTCPGASYELTVRALDPELIRSAATVFLEGYLWGPEAPRQAMLEAARIAQSAGRTVAFTLSESLRIGNRREGVMGMIDAGLVDMLFGSEHEFAHLTGCGSLTDCIDSLAGKVGTLVITRGADGAVAVEDGEAVERPAAHVAKIVDTTGAGDQFAAGFLMARCRGFDLARSLDTGAICAAEVISHFGARPEADLREMAGL